MIEGAVCRNWTTTCKTYEILQKFIQKRVWEPRVEQFCTAFKNLGLKSDELPTCDSDIAALKTSSAKVGRSLFGDLAEFSRDKALHLLKLLDVWVETCTLKLLDVEDLLKLALTVAIDNSFKVSNEVPLQAASCIGHLMSDIPQEHHFDLDMIRRTAEFCLKLAPDVLIRLFVVKHLCTENEALRAFLAYRVLEQFHSEKVGLDAQGPAQGSFRIPIPPSAQHVCDLVSKSSYPLISANRSQKRLFNASEICLLDALIELIGLAVGYSEEEEVHTLLTFIESFACVQTIIINCTFFFSF